MHITITGSHGFIGSHLVNHLLSNNHSLNCWDKEITQDINKFTTKTLLSEKTDVIIHLAAHAGVRESFERPNEYWENNVVNTKRIFDEAQKTNTRVIYASSSSCLEWHNNPYAMTKYVTEFIAPENSVGLRFSTVWGQGARESMLVSKIKNRRLEYATTHQRDFIHISDVITAIQTIIDHPDEKGIFEVGFGRTVGVDQLVAYNGIDVPIKEGEPYEIQNNCLPSHRLRSLGWQPKKFIMDEKL